MNFTDNKVKVTVIESHCPKYTRSVILVQDSTLFEWKFKELQFTTLPC